MQTKVKNQYLKEFIMLDKIYKNDDKFDYINNDFSFKMIIFFDKYKQIGLLKDAYI